MVVRQNTYNLKITKNRESVRGMPEDFYEKAQTLMIWAFNIEYLERL